SADGGGGGGGGGGGALDLSAACSGAPEPVSAPAEPFVTPEPPALSAVERAPELSTMAPFSIRAESAGAGARPVTSRFSIARSRGNGPPEGSSALPNGRRDSPPTAPRTDPAGAEGSISMSNSPRSTFSTDGPGRGKMGCRPVREAPLSSAGSGVISPESPLGSPLLPVRAAPGGATGGGAIAGAANAVAPTSATIAQAHSRGARRSARPVAWSWLETPTALLSPQQETRNHKPTLKSRQPNSESVKEASGFVNRLSQNGNSTVMINEAASPKSLDSKMDGSTAVPRAQNSA